MTDSTCEKCGGWVRIVPARPEYGLEAKELHYLGASHFVGERCPADNPMWRADVHADDERTIR